MSKVTDTEDVRSSPTLAPDHTEASDAHYLQREDPVRPANVIRDTRYYLKFCPLDGVHNL